MESDKKIEKNISKLLRNVAEGEETAFEVSDLLSADGDMEGRRLEIGRRKLQPEKQDLPELARSPVACHTFYWPFYARLLADQDERFEGFFQFRGERDLE